MLQKFIISLFILLIIATNAKAENYEESVIKAMQTGGHLLLIRHANAPGFGDPENIQIGDCSTQRNLDEVGRTQAKNIGDWLRKNNIEVKAIYSSQWCRCMETAKLINLSKVRALPALNSFYEKTENREPNIQALKQFISSQPNNKKLIIMVTHQVTISALTGKYVTSGEGVLLKLNSPQSYDAMGLVGKEWLK